ncbi:Hypothetical predicted protein [Mytilus galloprovincialis]|uniref:OPA3-like protein n=1 Tax=Mytilus galloprovincialis TaxID=29158 RepID=A0A8B6FID8_MYTGA|nr:Hypothetical predicted protein [Mytilus galloprovincialis]
MLLPIGKLATLLINQFTRPVVESVSQSAKHYPNVRAGFIRVAQRYHSIYFTSKSKALGFVLKEVKPLSEDRAIDLGARLLGELIVYGISAGLLLFEYNRQTLNDKIKAEFIKFELAKHEDKIKANRRTIESLIKQMFELENENKSLESKLKLICSSNNIHTYEIYMCA